MKQLIEEIAAINNKIDELQQQRSKLVSDNTDKILTSIRKKMDWKSDDICQSRVEYSSFEQSIMAQIKIKWDPNARYVFDVNSKGRIHLRFREDYSLCHQ